VANPYKNADKKKRVAPPGHKVEELPVEPVVEPETETPVAAPAPEPIATTSLADMIEKKEVGKACGFYLSPSSIKKLDKAAKQLKCSKSKALDLLIQKYL
jgi:hypothetical protein